LRYEEMQINVLKIMRPHWSRAVSLDIETHVSNLNFLTNERILAISFSRRVSGALLDASGIETKSLFLELDDDDSERQLLIRFDEELSKINPLCVIGYGHRQYDIPLFCIKKQCYKLLLWKLVDLCESAMHIDLYHILKYKRYKRLEDAISSPEFGSLPLMKVKGLVTGDRENKGKEIFRLWKDDRETLKKYVEGDAHDVLLIAESMVERPTA